MLLNEPEYHRAARHLALRALGTEGGGDDARRLDFVFETITSHLPDDQERALLLESLAQLRGDYAQRAALAHTLRVIVLVLQALAAIATVHLKHLSASPPMNVTWRPALWVGTKE